MERFEFEDERTLDLFSGFTGKTKVVFTALIDNIKANIKGYEARIEGTTKEIEANEISREKCTQEITKMEGRISDIKDAIENVENTYKKIADAYSSTSKGETKELYSEIIDGAKANCEKDVEKNRSEIARLNSDIEAIKNNISEFTKIIDDLNKNLDNYNLEVYKFNKALEYMDKTAVKTNEDLDEISSKKEILKKAEVKTTKSVSSKKSSSKSEDKAGTSKASKETSASKSSVFSALEDETFKTTTSKKEVKQKKAEPYDETLRQIYDLTGYKPADSKFETKHEEPKIPVVEEDKKVYTNNLESLFSTSTAQTELADGAIKEETNPFLENNFSNWEDILNTPADTSKKETVSTSGSELEATANQLLNPYGTDYKRLISLVGKEITYKNGSKVPFVLSVDDVVKAVNAIDGNDLKAMKTVGPETTILRKVMRMKEGNI